ncbi:hypothetical protein SISNIDRAFT_453036 [Sistotremastrum niveocremeum HHB9708]|uniref:Uncharacterized protein n=1 Tax=Sistotremastrum niveocremeum HHB9708 TaxID=1314777 RepID=A0A164WAB7_9AGAM|nr:hypothetical protein SISNIDRAFT_453036 [Sistotremastrum niveocremeum HHB9708]
MFSIPSEPPNESYNTPEDISSNRKLLLDGFVSVEDILETALLQIKKLSKDLDATVDNAAGQGNGSQRDNSSAPLDLLRQAAQNIGRIGSTVECELQKTASNILEESNRHTDISQLPETLLSHILVLYVRDQLNLDVALASEHEIAPVSRKWTDLCLVCKQWHRILKYTAELWNVVDLSWPLEIIQNHAILSQDVPLHVRWSQASGFDSPKTKWLMSQMGAVDDLQLWWRGTSSEGSDDSAQLYEMDIDTESEYDQEYDSSSNAEFPAFWDKCLASSNSKMKGLRLLLGASGRNHVGHVLLPTLPFPELLRLELRDCWPIGALPSTLRRLDVDVRDGSFTVLDILHVLSQLPLVESASFSIQDSPVSVGTSEASILANRISVPHLRSLKIGILSNAHLAWLHERFFDCMPGLRNLEFTVRLGETYFELPPCLQKHASRAARVEIGTFDLTYVTDELVKHSFTFVTSGSGWWPCFAKVLPLLYRVPSLFIGHYPTAHRDYWKETLPCFNQLRDLQVNAHVLSISSLLLDLLETAPSVCLNLKSIYLDTSSTSDGKFRAAPVIDGPQHEYVTLPGVFVPERTDEGGHLEKLLQFKLDAGVPLQKLILSHNNWWTGDAEKLKQSVVVLVIRD